MAWRPHGRASVNASAPKAWATCDRCGFNYNHVDLTWDRQWAGVQIIRRNYLICDTCRDIPQEQLRAITLPPDPEPIRNARPEPYSIDEASFLTTELPTANALTTESGSNLVAEGGSGFGD